MTYLDEHIRDIVVTDAKEVKPEKIEYLCIKDYVMDDGTLAYRKDLTYTTDGVLNDNGYFIMPSMFDETHQMDTSGDFYEHFSVKKTTYSIVEDSIVNNVIESFIERSNVGFKKYGTNLDRKDLSVLEWMNHAQQEAMDMILYLEKLKQEYNE
jgi:hypothetical protein